LTSTIGYSHLPGLDHRLAEAYPKEIVLRVADRGIGRLIEDLQLYIEMQEDTRV
jgi:hypothetical protein